MSTISCYCAIAAHYGDRTAERSGVPLIKHIDEGLIVMWMIGASADAMNAFCLHPMFQTDDDLRKYAVLARQVDPYVMMLVMEYRARANESLSKRVSMNCGHPQWAGTPPTPGPLAEVRDMLIADKVQNRADFLIYHRATHPHAVELDYYFQRWLEVLGIDAARYQELVKRMKAW